MKRGDGGEVNHARPRAIPSGTAKDDALTSARAHVDNLWMQSEGGVPRGLEERFDAISEIGRGSARRTYQARDKRDGAAVAIKCLDIDRARDWKSVELFERETAALRSLDHPSIPRFREALELAGENGLTMCIVYELAEGHTLRELRDRFGSMPEREVVRILDTLLDVLGYLHTRTPPVLHRDVKPENVVRGPEGKVWLVDFGAVRDRAEREGGGSTVVGTYGYMAPEQFRGHAVPASDVYALGATALFLVTGRHPSDLPQRDLSVDFSQVPGGSPALRAWIARALEPSPDRRFRTVHEARAALHAPPARTRSSIARAVALSAVLVVLTGVAAVVVTWDHVGGPLTRARGRQIPPPAPDSLPPRLTGVHTLLSPGRHARAHPAIVTALVLSSDGQSAYTASETAARRIDTRTLEVTRTFGPERGKVYGVALSKDDALLYAVGTRLVAWDARSGAEIAKVDAPHRGDGIAVLTSAGGESVFTAGGDGVVKRWDAKSLSEKQALAHGAERVTELALSPDGSVLATGDGAGAIRVWDTAQGTLLSTTQAHAAPLRDLAFSPDGTQLASAGDDKVAKVWAVRAGGALTRACELVQHTKEVWGVTYSPSGRHLMTTGKDSGVFAWDPATCGLRDTLLAGAPASKLVFVDRGLAFVAAGIEVGHVAIAHRGAGRRLPIVSETGRLPRRIPEERVAALNEEAAHMLDVWPRSDGRAIEEKVKEAHRLRAGDPDAFANLARLELYRGVVGMRRYQKAALVKARAALSRVPSEARTRYWYVTDSRVALGERDFERARGSADHALTLAPLDSDALHARALVDVEQGRFAEGLERLTRAVENAPHRDATLRAATALSEAYQGLLDVDAARAAHELAVSLAPDDPWLHQSHALFLLQYDEDPEAAVAAARRSLAAGATGAAKTTLAYALAALGERALWERRKPAEARALFDEAIATEPDARGYYGRAAALRLQAHLDKNRKLFGDARADLRRAASSDPTLREVARARDELDALERAFPR